MFHIYLAVALSAFVWFYIIYRSDRLEPEPLKILIYLLIVGGFMSSMPASLLNMLFAQMTGFMESFINGTTHLLPVSDLMIFSIFVGFNEELFKSLITIFLIRKLKSFNEPIDGLIYSMTVALGFAAYENIHYGLAGGLDTLVLRSLTSVPIHIGLACIWGMGISRSKFLHGNLKILNIIPSICMAAFLHGIYDFFQFNNGNERIAFYIALISSAALILFALRRMKLYLEESPFLGVLRCKSCGFDNPLKSMKCEKCGNHLIFLFYKICKVCGTRNRKSVSKCRNCKSDI